MLVILAYYYILGQYLGDGCISKYPRTYKLRIFASNSYPGIILKIKHCLSILFPKNKIGSVNKIGCVELTVYSSAIPIMFPHIGIGHKHERKIELCDFQYKWFNENSIELLLGLFHSDGCYYKQRTLKNGSVIMNYSFSNKSKDIHEIYQKALIVNNIKFSYHKKTKNDEDMMITGVYNKKNVNLLYSLIGNKKTVF